MCPDDVPPGSSPSGSGVRCYATGAACNSGATPALHLTPSLRPGPLGRLRRLPQGPTPAALRSRARWTWLSAPGGASPPSITPHVFVASPHLLGAWCPGLTPPLLAPLDAPTPGRSGVAGGSSPQMLYSCPYDYPPGALPNGFGGWCFTNATACAAGASPSRKQAHAMAAGRAAAAE